MSETLKYFRKKEQFRGTPTVVVDASCTENMETHDKNWHHIAEILEVNKVNLLTTRCVAAESKRNNIDQILKKLGIDIIESCGHERKKISGPECISSLIQHGNANGYFVASGDEELVRTMQSLPLVPIIVSEGRGMALRKPSTFQREAEEDDQLGRGGRVGGR